jgi:hypothetical protein
MEGPHLLEWIVLVDEDRGAASPQLNLAEVLAPAQDIVE